jgi:putative glutamine amidotransferase
MSKRPFIMVLEGLSGSSECVEEAGGDVISIYPSVARKDDIRTMLGEGMVDGLLLTGGGDVDPRRYGQTASKQVYGVSEDRDTVEMLALDWAHKWGIPIMGICRGSQIMNVHAGGTLWQHLPERFGNAAGCHKHGVLGVTTRKNSRLREAIGLKCQTMHLHHQAVRRVGKGFRPASWHRDGVVEAIESLPGMPWRVGVQFHPEYADFHEPERALFRHFVLAAAEGAGMAAPSIREPLPKAFAVSGVGWASAGSRKSWYDDMDEEWPTVIGGAKVAYKGGTTSVSYDDHRYEPRICDACLVEFDWDDDYFAHLEHVHKVIPNGEPVTFAGKAPTSIVKQAAKALTAKPEPKALPAGSPAFEAGVKAGQRA